MKKFIALVICLVFAISGIYAQAGDTLPYNPALTSPDGLAQLGSTLVHGYPKLYAVVTTWLPFVLLVLTIVQFILKRIPTAESVKLGGVVGWITNFLTAWQKDNLLSKCVVLLIGMSFLMSSCSVSKNQAILKGACEVRTFSSYTKPAPGADTVAGLPGIIQGKDSVGVYMYCDNAKIFQNYPHLTNDMEKAGQTLTDIIFKALGIKK